jgi:hypothetical protein
MAFISRRTTVEITSLGQIATRNSSRLIIGPRSTSGTDTAAANTSPRSFDERSDHRLSQRTFDAMLEMLRPLFPAVTRVATYLIEHHNEEVLGES